jgi:hypothetical protein
LARKDRLIRVRFRNRFMNVWVLFHPEVRKWLDEVEQKLSDELSSYGDEVLLGRSKAE